jgi:hypothetical protein
MILVAALLSCGFDRRTEMLCRKPPSMTGQVLRSGTYSKVREKGLAREARGRKGRVEGVEVSGRRQKI